MHPHFKGHLLSLDKDTEFPINLPFWKKLEANLLSNSYPAHVRGLLFVKMECWWKKWNFSEIVKSEKHEHFNQI